MRKSINPHRPSDIMGEFREAGQEGVEEAVAHAREAFSEWREQSAVFRGNALARIANDTEERAEELARLVVREVGSGCSQPFIWVTAKTSAKTGAFSDLFIRREKFSETTESP